MEPLSWAEIGKRVEDRRNDVKGWTVDEAAARADVSVSTWGNLENGRREAYNRPTLRRICYELGWPRNQIAVWRGDEAELEPEPEPVPADINPGAARRFDEVVAKLDRMEAWTAPPELLATIEHLTDTVDALRAELRVVSEREQAGRAADARRPAQPPTERPRRASRPRKPAPGEGGS